MEAIKPWLIPLAIHLIYFVGVVYLVGFLIYLLNRCFYRLLGGGMFVCYATGLIGTPLHELSHALMCLLFGHRIVEMRLFSLDRRSGTLGYVTHSYRKTNLYHVLGNYFIGVAPILLCSGFLCLCLRLLLPEAFGEFAVYLGKMADWLAQGELLLQGQAIWAIFKSFLVLMWMSVSQWQFWAFLVLALCVSIHMNLSGADILGSLGALPMLVILLGGAHAAVFYMFPQVYPGFVHGLNVAGAYLAGVLMFSLGLSLTSVVLALPVFLIRRLVTKG